MKDIEEIDCNEDIWTGITCNLQNGWGGFENECRFAFKTKNKDISEDEINDAFYDKYPEIDQIIVEEVKLIKKDYPDKEKGMRYFGVSIIIYNSGI